MCGSDGDVISGSDGGKFAIMESKWIVEPTAIGEGGFGSVHLCKSKANQKQRAMKAMRLANDLDREDFLAEVEIMKKIKKHRNICHILDSGTDRRYGYLVMQSCTGGELFDRIASKNMTEADAAMAVQDIIAALKFIHGKRVIHRDLKPENVLYKDKDPGSPLKLIDFGLAIQLPNKGGYETEVCGTTSYMAPEVLNGRYATECDMWSLGVMVYFMLSGSLPFKGRNDAEKEARIQAGAISFSSPAWEKISEDGKDFVKQLLEKDVSKRMTGKKALAHTWIAKRGVHSDTPINEEVVKVLKQHANQTRFQRAMRHKMAMLLTTEELHKLRNLFEALDTDGTGTVSMEELSKALKESAVDDAASKALSSLDLSSFDLDGDGEINWREFVGGCVQDHQMYNDDNIERLFTTADVNQDGKLSLDEITKLLGSDDHELKRELGEKLAKARMGDNDPTNDGKTIQELHMTKEEFKKVLQDSGEAPSDVRSRTKGRRPPGAV